MTTSKTIPPDFQTKQVTKHERAFFQELYALLTKYDARLVRDVASYGDNGGSILQMGSSTWVDIEILPAGSLYAEKQTNGGTRGYVKYIPPKE